MPKNKYEEPWKIEEVDLDNWWLGDGIIRSAEDDGVAVEHADAPAGALQRIIDCVNAFAGIENVSDVVLVPKEKLTDC